MLLGHAEMMGLDEETAYVIACWLCSAYHRLYQCLGIHVATDRTINNNMINFLGLAVKK